MRPDSRNASAGSLAGAGGSTGFTQSAAANNVAGSRPSAIERQMAITAGLDHPFHTHREMAEARRKSRPFGLTSFFLLVFLVAAGLALLFTDMGRSLQDTVSTVKQIAESAINKKAVSSSNDSRLARPALAINSVPASSSVASASQPAQKKAAEVSTPAALSIPIADVSLRERPELLEQLVRTYRANLADDPHNSTARVALDQLQERSLSELQTIILEEDDAAAVKSMEFVSRLFPEAADNVRYKYLVARVDRMHDQGKDKSAAKPESAALATAALPNPASTPPVSISSEKNTVSTINSATSSPAINNAAEHASKTTENAVSSKPEIRAVSITPGAIIHDRFVPDVEGNAFMVEVSYRNFDKLADESEVSLIARLGVPGYSNVLAEAPVEIFGDRGTKSFVMTTLMPAGDSNEYKLNFILNGEFLASRTVRVSR